MTTRTPTVSAAAVAEDASVELDLSAFSLLLDRRHAMRFNEAHVIDWLRSSGGTLTEQIMKHAAADAIERYAAAAGSPI